MIVMKVVINMLTHRLPPNPLMKKGKKSRLSDDVGKNRSICSTRKRRRVIGHMRRVKPVNNIKMYGQLKLILSNPLPIFLMIKF
jgi:hypothetical protein